MHIRRWTVSALLFAIAISPTPAQQSSVRLELIPPSPMTDKIDIDIRAAVENHSPRTQRYTIGIYLDQEADASRISNEEIRIPARASSGVYARRSAAGLAGQHRIIIVVAGRRGTERSHQSFEVLPSKTPSTRTIDGAWIGLIHWSDQEARYWNADIRKLSEDGWRQQIQGMHNVGMDTVVVQQVFQNQEYYGRNNIANTGYKGTAGKRRYFRKRRTPASSLRSEHVRLLPRRCLGCKMCFREGFGK